MQMQSFALGSLIACAAYLLVTYAFFILADRTNSANARFAAIGFAYCALVIVAQLVLSLSPALSGIVSFDPMAPHGIMYWVLFGMRPYVLLIAAIFVLRFARYDVSPGGA